MLCMIATTSFAQKCKEIIDPITNEKKIEFLYAEPYGFGNLQYEIKNSTITLTKQFYYSGAINTIASAGLEVFFKLENGEVVKLKTNKESSPKMYAGMGITTGYNFTFSLSKEDLGKFAASPLILIRVPKITEEGYYDLDKKNLTVKKSKKALMKGAACMGTF